MEGFDWTTNQPITEVQEERLRRSSITLDLRVTPLCTSHLTNQKKKVGDRQTLFFSGSTR